MISLRGQVGKLYIFVDESGSFTPAAGRGALSVVGSLVIPERKLQRLEKAYARLRRNLPRVNGEVKGKNLSEKQVASVVNLVKRSEGIFECVAMDMADHKVADIEAHRLRQVTEIRGGLSAASDPKDRQEAIAVADRLSRVSKPLYAQSLAMFELVWSTCEIALNYHSQRHPSELRAFCWTFDGKHSSGTTDWESLWAKIVVPFIYNKSLATPLNILTSFGDFRQCAYFTDAQSTEDDTTAGWLDIRRLLGDDLRFSSAQESGLELVDILTNAIRRALVGNLHIEGWRELPKLMAHRDKGAYMSFVLMHNRKGNVGDEYARILYDHFRSGGREVIAPRFRRDRV